MANTRLVLLISVYVCCVTLTEQAKKSNSKSSKGSGSSSSSSSKQTTDKPKPTVELTAAALYEHENHVTTLTTLPCGLDTVVSIKSVKSNTRSKPQCAICFQVYPSAYDEYELRFLPLEAVEYSRDQSYSIKMDCRDHHNIVLKQITVIVRVEPNTPPYFHTLHEIRQRTMFELADAGLAVDSCSDDDETYGDHVSYRLVAMEPFSPFFTLTGQGLIVATGDLRGECHSPITFLIQCQDRFEHSAPDPLTLELIIQDGNEMPAVSGLNQVVEVSEDAAAGTVLARFSVIQAGDSPLCHLAAEPPQALHFFHVQVSDSQGQIEVWDHLNYEQDDIRYTNLTVTCSDGFCMSQVTYLYVIVTDVNEPISLYPRDVTLSVNEGPISADPHWTPLNEDSGDDFTYTIVGGNDHGRFAVDPISGVIISTLEYDVDNDAMPALDTLLVQVQDEAGHSSTSTVTLAILDINDHRPVFDRTRLAISINDCNSTLGSTVGNVSATDLDSSFQGNNIITYSGGSGPITIGSGGNIIAGSGLSAGSTYVVQATATDSGQVPGPLSSSPDAFVTVIVTECPATTTTTVPTTWADSTMTGAKINWWWMALASLLSLTLVSVVTAVLWKLCSSAAWQAVCRGLNSTCCTNWMNRPWQPRIRSPRTVHPAITRNKAAVRNALVARWSADPIFKTRASLDSCSDLPNPPKNGNKGFWQERFADDDYTTKPARTHTPSPLSLEGVHGPLLPATWRTRELGH